MANESGKLPHNRQDEIIATLRQIFPKAEAFYLFGSRATGEANAQSDFDFAILVQQPVSPADGAQAKLAIAALLRQDVDFVDLLRADTVTRFLVVSHGVILWEGESRTTAEFENVTFSVYASLNQERARYGDACIPFAEARYS